MVPLLLAVLVSSVAGAHHHFLRKLLPDRQADAAFEQENFYSSFVGAPDGSSTNPFANVTLIVHCRHSSQVCESRLNYSRHYERWFRNVVRLSNETCDVRAGDPYACVARIAEGEGAESDGIFYMHFDALLRPKNLATVFDVGAMGWFTEPKASILNPGTGKIKCVEFTGGMGSPKCPWNWIWGRKGLAVPYMNAMHAIKQMPHFRDIDISRVYIGMDDLFYMPRAAFKPFSAMAAAFAREALRYVVDPRFHEAVVGTIRMVLQERLSLRRVNFGCVGNCCVKVPPSSLSVAEFRCGHPFQLQDEDVKDSFDSAVAADAPDPVSR